MEGRRNMMSSMVRSMTLRRPRAPVLRSMARAAMALRALGVKRRCTWSSSNSFWYWRTRAFLGSVRMRTRSASSRSSTWVMMGMRPTNSGIRPNFTRSWGWIFSSSSPRGISFLEQTWAPKPMELPLMREPTILSSPTKAPPTMNRILLVSMRMNSCWGCLRPPLGGMLASVPSMILSRACCTPSPDTSRVMEGPSLLREILSISSM